MNTQPALELRGIVKTFGSVQALRGADFTLAHGEIHALLGENGAGKSTLLQVAYGLLAPDAGNILVRGQRLTIRSPRDARAAGIGMVHQHFTSIGSFTVEENLALVRGRGAGPVPAPVEAFLQGVPLTALVESLSVGLQQRLEIVKALATGARILLLDEPSASLAPGEVEALLELASQFASEGGAVVLVTHKLREVFAAAHRVTVLRQGAVTLSAALAGQSVDTLATAMLGESARETAGPAGERSAPPSQSPIASLGGFALHPGELVGVAAVEGNGQRELLRRLAGVAVEWDPPPQTATRSLASFVPEDRTTEGLIPELSITENLVLGRDQDPRWANGARLHWSKARTNAARLMESFEIVAPDPDTPVGVLSGGNQQKVVLARALDAEPRLLVAENPTRGLDVRATAEIHARLREAARDGMAVVVYSSDLDEVLSLGERILVIRQGRVLEAPRGADRQQVGALMLGTHPE